MTRWYRTTKGWKVEIKRNKRMKITKSVALVLSSGGAKGYAHIGAIKAIEESGMVITSIAGTSMGALVGGLYAAGKLEQAFNWLKSLDNWEVLKMSDFNNMSTSGLLNGEFIFGHLNELLGDIQIEELPIDFCAIATNLDNGKEVVIRKGSLLEAIRMSISMPVLFTPYRKDGHIYVDGGIVNGLPVNRVARHKGDIVVAIDLDNYGSDSVRLMEEEVTQTLLSEKDAINATGILIKSMMSGKSVLESGLGFATNLIAPALSVLAKTALSSSSGNMFGILLDSFFVSMRQNKIMMRNTMKPEIYININLKGHHTFSFSHADEISDIAYNQVKREIQRLYPQNNNLL